MFLFENHVLYMSKNVCIKVMSREYIMHELHNYIQNNMSIVPNLKVEDKTTIIDYISIALDQSRATCCI